MTYSWPKVSFTATELLFCVQLFATPWTAAHQPSLSFGIPQSWLDSCPLNRWCYLTISCSVTPFFFCPQFSPAFRVFSSESVLHIRSPKYWHFSFSTSPSNEYSGLISFRIDWFDLHAVHGTQESSIAPQFGRINSSVLSLLYSPIFTSIHTTGKTVTLTIWTLVGKVWCLCFLTGCLGLSVLSFQGATVF